MTTDVSEPGKAPRMKFLPLDALIVDHTYQRDVDAAHAARILEKFEWRFFQAITVTEAGDGKYAVIDGQHRTVAAQAHPKINKVPCVIVEAKDVKEQAEGFIRMNMSQRRISPVEIYWAALAAGDPEYVRMAALFERTGVAVYSHSGYGVLPAKTTSAVNTVRNLIRRHGEPSVEAALKAIIAAWPDKTGALVSRIIEACEHVARTTKAPAGRIAVALAAWEPRRLVDQARIAASEQDIKIAFAVVQMITRAMEKRKSGNGKARLQRTLKPKKPPKANGKGDIREAAKTLKAAGLTVTETTVGGHWMIGKEKVSGQELVAIAEGMVAEKAKLAEGA